MWYNSCLAFMMVEINSRTSTQMIIMCGIYILNAVIQAVLFGVFVDQFIIIRYKSTTQQSEIDDSNVVMILLSFPPDLRVDIRNYLKRTFTTKSN